MFFHEEAVCHCQSRSTRSRSKTFSSLHEDGCERCSCNEDGCISLSDFRGPRHHLDASVRSTQTPYVKTSRRCLSPDPSSSAFVSAPEIRYEAFRSPAEVLDPLWSFCPASRDTHPRPTVVLRLAHPVTGIPWGIPRGCHRMAVISYASLT